MVRVIQYHPERFWRAILPRTPLQKLQIVVFLGGIIAGCGGDEFPERAFETQPAVLIIEPGEAEPPPPPAFEVVILKPAAGARFRQGEKPRLEFRVTMQERRDLPPELYAEIYQDGIGPSYPCLGGGFATPVRAEGNGRYRFSLDMVDVLPPGHYFIRASASRSVMRRIIRGSDEKAVVETIKLQPEGTSDFEITAR